jgi:hypothetical protein
MGSGKRQDRTYLTCKEDGRDHSGWKKEAFAANEGTVGGTEEIDREEVNVFTRRGAVGCIAWLGCARDHAPDNPNDKPKKRHGCGI